jgi:hypothetical protein
MPLNPLKQSSKKKRFQTPGFSLGRLHSSHSNLSCYVDNLKLRQPLPIQSHLSLFHLIPFHLIPSNSIHHLIAMADSAMKNGVFAHNNIWSHHEYFSGLLSLTYNLNRLLLPKTSALYLSFPRGARPLSFLALAPELA